MAAHERPLDRPGDRAARANGRNGHRDDAIVVPPRRPTAARPGENRPARAPRTELESRGRPAGPVRFAELDQWAASRQTDLGRAVAEASANEAVVDDASTVTEPDEETSTEAPLTGDGPVVDAPTGLLPATTTTAVLALAEPAASTALVTALAKVGPARVPVVDRGPQPAPIPVGPPTMPIALPASPPVVPTAPAAPVEPTAEGRPQIVSTRRSILRRRPRVRRVSRVLRRVDAWSVLKVSLILYALAYLILLVAGVLLWKVAIETGTLANVEGFVKELFGLTTFELHGEELYRASWTIGAFLVVAGTGLNVTAAVMFNLVTDLVGGVRVTVLEEEVRLVERGPSRRARRTAAAAMAEASAAAVSTSAASTSSEASSVDASTASDGTPNAD